VVNINSLNTVDSISAWELVKLPRALPNDMEYAAVDAKSFPSNVKYLPGHNRPGTHMIIIRNKVSRGDSQDQNIRSIFDSSRNGLNRRPESTVSPNCANKARSRDSMMIHPINRVLPVVPCILVIGMDPGRSSGNRPPR
jgi:hypothetical protein